MKIALVTIAYSSTACIDSVADAFVSSSHELTCELFLHSAQAGLADACGRFAQLPGVALHPHAINRGVSKSWNEGIFAAQARGADVIVVVNDDIAFASGDLEKIAAKASAHRDRYIISCAGTHLGFQRRLPSMGYSCFAINPCALERLGAFDENIFPAYCEDQDYAYRAKLAGMEEENCGDTQLTHAGSASLRSDPALFRQNLLTQSKNILYYVRKWGGPAGRESFRVPFNNPRFTLHIPVQQCAAPYGPAYDRSDRHIVRL